MTPPVEDPVGRDEYDTPAEVDAVFRTQRRIAVGYAVVFLSGVLLIPALTLVTNWWATGRLAGWWTTSFAAIGTGLYVFFFLLGIAAASLSTGVENRMLGSPDDDLDAETSGAARRRKRRRGRLRVRRRGGGP